MKKDVVVIGGGPAGLSAAIAAKKAGADVLLIEREARLGGILKQCVHDGFGLITFKEKLSGPEYAGRFIEEFHALGCQALLLTFVTRVEKKDDGFLITLVNRDGVFNVFSNSIILATGCRERTAKQIFLHGTRPSGIFTAGTAQNFVNLMGQMPTKKCVILGSGDIGLIMARRLTLEGAVVEGVYEAKPTPGGLTRNLHQCLKDFDIPLHLSHSVTRVFGDSRLTAVEISKVDKDLRPIKGTERIVECDALILSVGLIPENELALSLGISLSPHTKGPLCDQTAMTEADGVFVCGNALHVNDLVDYVSQNGETAGKNAASYKREKRALIEISVDKKLLYAVPQRLDLTKDLSEVDLFFRVANPENNATLSLLIDGKTFFTKKYTALRPPEMEKLRLDLSRCELSENSKIQLVLGE